MTDRGFIILAQTNSQKVVKKKQKQKKTTHKQSMQLKLKEQIQYIHITTANPSLK